MTHLHGHGDISRLMEDLFYGAVIALAQLLVELELIHVDGKGGTVGKVDARSVEDGFAVKVEGPGRIAGDRVRDVKR